MGGRHRDLLTEPSPKTRVRGRHDTQEKLPSREMELAGRPKQMNLNHVGRFKHSCGGRRTPDSG